MDEYSFQNLVLNKNVVNKLEQFFNDKTIPLNINIIGKKGYGKKSVLNCILNNCFNITLDDFTIINDFNHIYNYNDILYIPFTNLNSSETNESLNYIKKFCKYKSLFDDNKIIIFDNIDKNNNLFKIFLNSQCENNKIKLITTSNTNDKNLKKYYTTCMNIKIPPLNQSEFLDFLKKKKLKTNKKVKIKLYNAYKNNNNDLKFINYLLDNYQDQLIDETNDLSKSKGLKLTDNLLNKFNIAILNLCINYSPDNLEKIRQKLYLIHSLLIPSTEIISNNLQLLLKNNNVNADKKHKFIELSANTNKEIIFCDREVFYLENYFFKISKILNDL